MRQIRLLLQDLSAVVSALNRQTTRRRRREKELKARLHAMETRVNDLQQMSSSAMTKTSQSS